MFRFPVSSIQNAVPIKTVMCICGNTNVPSESEVKQCTTCRNYQHLKCIKLLAEVTRFYECPSCQFKHMDPGLEIVDTLVSASLLSYDDQIGGQLKKTLKFLYKSETSKKYMAMKQKGENIYIALRCIRLDNVGYEHHWPLNCRLFLNNRIEMDLKLPKIPPMSRPREDWPIIIVFDNSKFNDKSRHLKSMGCLRSENFIEIEINYKENDNDTYNYAFSVDVLKVLSKATSMNKTETVRDRDRLISLLSDGSNNSALVAAEKVSLIDVYSGNIRISKPARGLCCLHAKVFDFDSYLQMNNKSRKWNCPHCGKKATRIYIDGILEEFMTKNDSFNEVSFNFQSFSYSVLEPFMSKEKEKSKPQAEVICLDSDNENDQPQIANFRIPLDEKKDETVDYNCMKVERTNVQAFPIQSVQNSNTESVVDLVSIQSGLPQVALGVGILQSQSSVLNISNCDIINSATENTEKIDSQKQSNAKKSFSANNFGLNLETLRNRSSIINSSSSNLQVNSSNESIQNNVNNFNIIQKKPLKFQSKMLLNCKAPGLTINSSKKLHTLTSEPIINLNFIDETKLNNSMILEKFQNYYEELCKKDEGLRKVRDSFLGNKRKENII